MKKLIYLFIGLALTACNVQSSSDQSKLLNKTTTPGEVQQDKSNMKQNKTSQDAQNLKQWAHAPEMQIDSTKKYVAILKTDQGDIKIQLNADKTPKTVNNFVFLAKQKFYDNVIFHRVIKGFMIQTGDPTGTGMGGPGYKFDDEPFNGEYSAGTVAMANAGPNTNGSQFFIMHKDYPLPKNYVIFGEVISGMDVVNKIAEAPVTAGPSGESSKPVNPVHILSVDITEQ